MSFACETPAMVPTNCLLQRHCLSGGTLAQRLQRSIRSVAFAAYRPPPISRTTGPVLSRPLSTKSPSPPPGPKHASVHAHSHFTEGNLPYTASFKDKGKLTIPPAKHLAIGSFVRGLGRGVPRD